MNLALFQFRLARFRASLARPRVPASAHNHTHMSDIFVRWQHIPLTVVLTLVLCHYKVSKSAWTSTKKSHENDYVKLFGLRKFFEFLPKNLPYSVSSMLYIWEGLKFFRSVNLSEIALAAGKSLIIVSVGKSLITFSCRRFESVPQESLL